MLDVPEQMRIAVELFHYSLRFKDRLFVLQLPSVAALQAILGDLQVLDSSHIRLLICCPHEEVAQQIFNTWTARGQQFRYLRTPTPEVALAALSGQVTELLQQDTTPVLGFTALPTEPLQLTESLDRLAADTAAQLKAEKLFIFSDHKMLEADGQRYSHPSPAELRLILEQAAAINIGKERLERLIKLQENLRKDIIVLEAAAGSLFLEVFTHRGSGTLFSCDYPNVLRQATLADFLDITFMMQPYVQNGIITPLDSEELTKQIENFSVYTVNDQIVAVALLAQYGSWSCLQKICSLPRYQRRGRARSLVAHLIERSRQRGDCGVFSLSIEPKMWVFFTQLGFTEIAREELPREWRQNYDFSRPSRAFALRF